MSSRSIVLEMDKRFPTLMALDAYFTAEPAPTETTDKVEPVVNSESNGSDDFLNKKIEALNRLKFGASPGFENPAANIRLQDLFLEKQNLERLLEVLGSLDKYQSNDYTCNDVEFLVGVMRSADEDPISLQTKNIIREQFYTPEAKKRSSHLQSVLEQLEYPAKQMRDRNQDKKSSDATDIDMSNSPTLQKACSELAELGGEEIFTVLAQPLAQRLLFNFSAGKETYDPSKPEWIFQYFTKIIDRFVPYIQNSLQLIVDSPMPRLIEALFPIIVFIISSSYKLDTHMVSELLQFCAELESRYYCSKDVTDRLVFGLLTTDVLDKYIQYEQESYFKTVDLAIKQAIEGIDFDANVPSAKPTFRTLVFWQIYKQSDYLLRLGPEKVLKIIQMPLLQKYYDYLHDLKQSLNFASSKSKTPETADTSSLKLSKSKNENIDVQLANSGYLLGSSSFLAKSVDSYVLESLHISSDPELSSLMERFVAAFNELRLDASNMIGLYLSSKSQKGLKPYITYYDPNSSDSGNVRLRSGLDALKPDFKFVNELTSSSAADRARILVFVATRLGHLIWQNIIQMNVFNVEAAKNLHSDLELILYAWKLPLVYEFKKDLDAIDVFLGNSLDSTVLKPEERDGLQRRIAK